MKNCRMFLILMILIFIPALALAATQVDEGYCGDDLTWTLDSDGVLTIGGEGEMYDFAEYYDPLMPYGGDESSGAPWRYNHDSEIKQIVVGDSVTRIGNYAFYNCSNVKSVSMGSGVAYIGSYAFEYCTGLKQAVIPASVRVVEENAFSWCSNLTELTLEEGVQEIEDGAFRGTGISSFTFPDSVTAAGTRLFSSCKNLKSVRLGNGLPAMSNSFFGTCSALESVYIPASVTTITGGAFESCSALTTVEVDGGNTAYRTENGVLFTADGTKLVYVPAGICPERYTVPAGVKEIGSYAFYNCRSLTGIGLPEGLETVGDYAFYGTYLTETDLPESLTAIGSYAFSNTKLTKLDLPEYVTRIGDYAFCNTNLTEVTLPGREIALGTRMFRSCTELETVRVGGGVKTIPSWTFESCTALTDVILEDGIEEIASGAFSGCKALTGITLPLSVKKVGERAFTGCTALTDVRYPGSYEDWIAMSVGTGNDPLTAAMLKKYGTVSGDYQGFAWTLTGGVLTVTGSGAMPDATYSALPPWRVYASSVNRVMLSEEITEIGNYAFQGCGNLTEIEIPSAVTRIGSNAFSACTLLSEVEIPAAVRSIGNYAFDSSGLKTVVIPKGVTEIPYSAFASCKKLEKVTLPGTVTTIGGSAFSSCTVLERIYLPSSVRSIGSSAFDWDSALKSIAIPEGVETLESYVIHGCSELKTVMIPKSVKTVYLSAFEDCYALETVYYAGSQSEWDSIDFHNIYDDMPYNPLDGVQILFEQAAIGGSCGAGITWTLDAEGTLTLSGSGDMYDYGSGQAPWAEYADAVAEIVPGEGITRIGRYAFENCAAVEQMRLPGSLNSIGAGAFSGCAGLTEIIFDGTAGKWAQVSVEDGAIPEGVRIIRAVPEQILGLTVEAAEGALRISWTKIEEEETVACRIYRRAEDQESFTLAATVNGRETTEWTDTSVTAGTVYVYYAAGVSSLGVEGAVSAFTAGSVPLTEHVFGEWITDLEPTIYQPGHRYRECEDCGEREEEEIPKLEMTEEMAEHYGEATFRVVKAATGTPVSGASLIVKLSEEESLTLTTDGDGRAVQILPVGSLRVTAYAPGMLSRNITVQITGGACEIPEIGLSETDLLDAQITVEEMTYEEIVAAGIDTEAEGNQQIYKYTVQLEFSPEVETLNLDYLLNLNGQVVDWSLPGTGTGTGTGTGDDSGSEDSGWKPVTQAETTEPDQPVPIRYEPAPGSQAEPITVYPVSEQFYLVVYGETRWLKEMFDVEMLVINRSLTDTLEYCEATLELPEGLSLADMPVGTQRQTKSIGTVAGGEARSTHWYVRGDEEGDYGLTARLTAVMQPFGEEIDRTYTTEEYLHVFAGSALHVTYTVPDAAYYGEDYVIRAVIENVSDRTLYNISNMISDVGEYWITHERDGHSISSTQHIWSMNRLNSGFAHEFRSGDKLIMDISVPIEFESAGAQETLDAVQADLRKKAAIYDALITCKNLLSFADALDELIENAGKAIVDGVETVFGRFRVMDNFLGFLQASSDLFGNDTFNAFESMARVMEMVPVRYNVIAREVNVLEGSTAEIPVDFELKRVVPKLVITNPDKYMAAMRSVIFGDVLELPSTGIFLFDQWAERQLKDAFAYDAALEYLQAVENRSQNFKVMVPGKSDFDPLKSMVTISVWSERGTLSVEPVGMEGEMKDGKLQIDGSCVIRVTPGAGSDTLYVEADGETRAVQFNVAQAHTCSGVWLTAGYATEETDGLEIQVCETCRRIMDTRVTHSCGDHEFSEYVTELEPTETEAGVQTRVCEKCHVLDYRLIDVNGEEITVPELELSAGRLDLKPGEKAQLFAALDGKDPGELIWSVEDAEVASVDQEGVVTLLKAGETTVTVQATDGKSKEAVCAVRMDDLPALKLPVGLERVEDDAMAGDGSLRCIDLRGTGAAVIGERAFAGCENLVKILPAAGTVFEANAFSGCEEAVCYCPDEAGMEKAKEAGLSYVLVR